MRPEMDAPAFTTDRRNPHLARQPVLLGAPLHQARTVVYAVHGRGQGAGFMVEQAERVGVLGVAWVLPQAHEDSWYPLSFLEPSTANQPYLDQSLEMVGVHAADLVRMGRDPGATVLFGFSQGACLLAEYLLRVQPRCAGAFLHTGGYVGADHRPWARVGDGLSGAEVILHCAEDDEFVPLSRVQETAGALAGVSARIELTTYDDPVHHLNEDSIVRLRRMLTSRDTD